MIDAGRLLADLTRLRADLEDVLSVDDASDTVQLNRDLLDTQFGIASDRQ